MEPANYLTPIQLWNVNDFEVRLFQNSDYLEYETVDNRDGKAIYKNSVNINGKTAEQAIPILKNCRIIIGEKGDVNFCHNYHTWNVNNCDVQLIKGADDLTWDIFCNLTKSSSFHSLKTSTIPSTRCHPETVVIIEKIKNESFKDRKQIFRLIDDFKLVQITNSDNLKEESKRINNEIEFEKRDLFIKKTQNVCLASFTSGTVFSTLMPHFGYGTLAFVDLVGKPALVLGGIAATSMTCTLVLLPLCPIICAIKYFWVKKQCELSASKIDLLIPQKPLLIEIEPKITAPSAMDDRILVSKFTWAVTLITGPKGDSQAHTAIIIEGLANACFQKEPPDGQYFIHKSEFNPPVISRLYCATKFKRDILLGIEKSETWMISSEKVDAMMRLIDQERQLQEDILDRGEKVMFNTWGKKTMIGEDAHSCFTWAREKIGVLGIKLVAAEFTSDVSVFEQFKKIRLPETIVTIPRAYTNPLEYYHKKPCVVQI